MRCIYILVFSTIVAGSVFGQVSTGFIADWSKRDMSQNKRVENYVAIGLLLKKPVGLSWTFGAGIGYKNLNARLVDYINDSDFAPHFRAKYPNKTFPLNFYFNSNNKYGFNFVYMPVLAELKILPGFKLRYMYHANWHFKANKDVSKYLENGAKSVAQLSGNHDLAVMFMNAATQAHLVIGVVIQPELLNKSQTYNYQFTPDFYNKYGGTLSFYIGISMENNVRPRKRSIL